MNNNHMRRDHGSKLVKHLSVMVSVLFVIAIVAFVVPNKNLISIASGGTIYVNTTGSGGAYTSIQAAIDAADPGDKVYVYNRTYYEHIIINKSINLTGENFLGWRPVIDGLGSQYVVNISNVDYFNMSEFEVINSGMGLAYSGIIVISSSNVNISNNVVHDNCYGVCIASSSLINVQENEIYNNLWGICSAGSSNNTFVNNIVHDLIKSGEGGGTGIFFSGCPYYNNKIIGNIVYNNDADGIHLEDKTFWNNTLINNIIYDNRGDGIFIGRGTNNFIVDNIVHHNGLGTINPRGGIHLSSSINNVISGNTVHDNGHGIMLTLTFSTQPSKNNTIADNTCSNNEYGIYLDRSEDNNIIGNTIYSNTEYGIYLSDSNNNTFHHNNIIENTNQVYLETSKNVWHDGMGEGNYWSDYYGVDDGSNGRVAGDGVGDTEIPHPFINQGNGYYRLDNYPLINPVGNYIFLYEGWNLVSVPFIQTDQDLGEVLKSIEGSYDTVWGYNVSDNIDHWKVNSTLKPSDMNDLDNIDHKMGFWIHITKPGGVLFEYYGIQPSENQSIALYPGWNLVGFPSLTRKDRTAGLNNLTFGTHVNSIWSYDAAIQRWEDIGPSDYFEVGRGYWIYAKKKCEWEVPL